MPRRRSSYNSSPRFLLDAPRTSPRLKYTSAFEGLQRGCALTLEQRRRCTAGVATRRERDVGRDAVYKWTYIWTDMREHDDGEINPQNEAI